VSDIAKHIIKRHQMKEQSTDDPYQKGWHRGYWEGISDCLEIECKEDERTPVWLAKVLNK
jgi:hypothetical protein